MVKPKDFWEPQTPWAVHRNELNLAGELNGSPIATLEPPVAIGVVIESIQVAGTVVSFVLKQGTIGLATVRVRATSVSGEKADFTCGLYIVDGGPGP